MPRVELSASFALTARCTSGKKTDYWDKNQVSGFVLECRSSGGKTYYLRYFDQNGRQRQHKIGAYGEITFDQARKAAKRLRSEVVLGGDPAVKKAEKKAIPTYAELATQHLAHAKTYQRSYSTTEMYVRRHILPRWGKSRLTDIGQQDVAKWLADKSEEGLAPATVEKIRVIFGRSFALGERWGIAGCDKNPVRGIPRRPINNARERYLTPEEAERLSKAAAQSRNPLLGPIVGLLLRTGARITELLSARWEHVDVDRRAWLIPTSKNGKSRHVPLSQAAVDIINGLPKGRSAWLFPNPKNPKKRLTTIKHSWQTARDIAGLPGMRIHDCRHAAASFLVAAGIDQFHVGKILGHSSQASTARYSHVNQSALLAAVEAGAAKMKVAAA